MLIGEYFLRHYRGRFYAKAQNLSRQLRATYDKVLKSYNLLLMPTLPMKATPLPPRDAPLRLYIQRAFEMIANTSAYDATGHPAMSIPCGMSDGLPVPLERRSSALIPSSSRRTGPNQELAVSGCTWPRTVRPGPG